LQWKPLDGTNLWLTYSEGNLPGKFNNQLSGLSDTEIQQVIDQLGEANIFVDEESLKNYEIGWKQVAWQGRAQFSLVGYRMDWDNIKARIPVIIILDSGRPASQNVTTNQASAEITGLEFEGQAAVTENLLLQAAINWSDAEFTEFNCAGFVRQFTTDLDCAGNKTIQFPEWSGSVAATWNASLSADWDYYIRGDARYVGERYADVANSAVLGDFWRVNLRVGFARDDLRLEGYVTNLFDDDNYEAGQRWSDFSGPGFYFTANQGVALTPPRKRVIGLRMSYDF